MSKSSKKNVYIVGPDNSVTNLFWGRNYNIDRIRDPDLIVFTGGSDINPKIYGHNKIHECGYIWDERDKRELEIYEKFKGVPMVGICRGAQLLNSLSGGSLYQHVTGHQDGPHEVTDLTGVMPYKTFTINSCHHQMMIPSDEGEILCFSKNLSRCYLGDPSKNLPIPKVDVEVVYYEKTKSLCFQAHPEWYGKQKDADCPTYFFKLIDEVFN